MMSLLQEVQERMGEEKSRDSKEVTPQFFSPGNRETESIRRGK